MANLRRNDTAPVPGRTPRQEPIVLARLPRIGAAAPSVATPSVATTSAAAPMAVAAPPSPMPSTTAASHAPPLPETMPSLDLRTEIDQRIRLHVAEPPAEPHTSPASHFADRQHSRRAEPVVIEPVALDPATLEPEPTRKHQRISQPQTAHTRSSSHRSSSDRPETLSEKLFQLHSQLSPHAGLIVALALIASAALLYWMIVGPVQVSPPLYDDYGSQLQSDDFGTTSLNGSSDGSLDSTSPQMPESYVPQFTAQLPHPEPTSRSSEQWNEVTLPTPSATHEPIQPSRPGFEPRLLLQGPTSSDSPFLKSRASEPLDLTKAMQTPMRPISSELPQALPAVAQRPTNSTNR